MSKAAPFGLGSLKKFKLHDKEHHHPNAYNGEGSGSGSESDINSISSKSSKLNYGNAKGYASSFEKAKNKIRGDKHTRYKEASRLLDSKEPEDLKLAIEILTKLDEEGHSESSYRLGRCYYAGKGVEIDVKKSFLFYSKAVEKDPENLDASFRICVMLIEGNGCKQDMSISMVRLLTLARRKFLPAVHLMGYACEHGINGGRDLEGAIYWYSEGAKRDYPPSLFAMANLLYFGMDDNPTSSKPPTVRIEEYLLKAASHKLAAAMLTLGVNLNLGLVSTIDKSAALPYIQGAADAGHAVAQWELYLMWKESNFGNKDDMPKYFRLLKSSASGWCRPAMEELVRLYQVGFSPFLDPNPRKVAQWRKATEMETPWISILHRAVFDFNPLRLHNPLRLKEPVKPTAELNMLQGFTGSFIERFFKSHEASFRSADQLIHAKNSSARDTEASNNILKVHSSKEASNNILKVPSSNRSLPVSKSAEAGKKPMVEQISLPRSHSDKLAAVDPKCHSRSLSYSVPSHETAQRPRSSTSSDVEDPLHKRIEKLEALVKQQEMQIAKLTEENELLMATLRELNELKSLLKK